MTDRYFARSASDRTQHWSHNFVADRQRGGLNVTAELMRDLVNPQHGGTVFFLWRGCAEWLAERANKADSK